MPYSDGPSEKDRLYPEPLLPTITPGPDPKLLRRTKARRVFRFLHVLTLIWIVVHLASRTSLFHKLGFKCGRNTSAVKVPQQIGNWDYDIPHDTHLVECAELNGAKNASSMQGFAENNIDNSAYTSTVYFDLPVSSDSLFLLSRGQNLGGIATVENSDDQAEDTATIEVSIYYNVQEALDWTKVCLLERQDNENGVGIFTPIWGRQRYPDSRERRLGYSIKLILPTLADKSPLKIKSFETDLPNTSHHLKLSGQDVSFDSVNLRGTNGIIQVKDLAMRVGTIASTNGKITGELNATESLILKTTNGPINVNVTLTNAEPSSNATLVAHTTNSPLKASISLLSSSESEVGGSFYITTQTTNGPLGVEFTSAPVDSKLELLASTTNSPAILSLHETYEGTFDLRTSRFFRPSLVVKEVEDPAGKGRVRRVDTKLVRGGELSGEVSWDEESKNVGVVKLSTTNSPVSLKI